MDQNFNHNGQEDAPEVADFCDEAINLPSSPLSKQNHQGEVQIEEEDKDSLLEIDSKEESEIDSLDEDQKIID
jgi:hypothetical protein